MTHPLPKSTLFPYTTLFRSDALAVGEVEIDATQHMDRFAGRGEGLGKITDAQHDEWRRDRKSTRLNSSHPSISYAVFCLKKKTATSRSPWSKLPPHSEFGLC